MEEADEFHEEYDDETSNSSNSNPEDAFDTNEPNFDEPAFDDELPADANQGMGKCFLASPHLYGCSRDMFGTSTLSLVSNTDFECVNRKCT